MAAIDVVIWTTTVLAFLNTIEQEQSSSVGCILIFSQQVNKSRDCNLNFSTYAKVDFPINSEATLLTINKVSKTVAL